MKASALTVFPNEASDLDVLTFVLWLGCFFVGALGLLLPYPKVHIPQPAKLVTRIEMLNVELKQDPQVPREPTTPTIAPALTAPVPLSAPQPPAVAEPSPAIAFAVPVAGPVRIVEARRAVSTRPAPVTAPVAAAPAPQPLIFGQGEGRQPAPDYPARAQSEGQEGNVSIRLTVGADGRVQSAETLVPSPWRLLNDSALRTVRERWRFSPGVLRVYDVVIRFELTQ